MELWFDGGHLFSGEMDAGLTLKLLRKITGTRSSYNDTMKSTASVIQIHVLRNPW